MNKKEEVVKVLVKEFGLLPQEVEDTFNQQLSESAVLWRGASQDEIQGKAALRTFNFYKKGKLTNLDEAEGIILSVSAEKDWAAIKYQKAIDTFNKDPVQAVKEGLVNKNGVPIDNRQNLNNGLKNIRFGKPLPKSQKTIEMFGLCRKVGEKQLKNFRATIYNPKFIQESGVVLNQPVKFKARLDNQNEFECQVNMTPFTRFTVVSDNAPVGELIKKRFGETTKLENFEKVHLQLKEQRKFSKIVLTGVVNDLILDVPNRSDGFTLMNENFDVNDLTTIRVKLTPFLSQQVNYAEGSIVTVVGDGWVFNKDDGSKMVGITSTNVYAAKEHQVEKAPHINAADAVEPETDENSESVDDIF